MGIEAPDEADSLVTKLVIAVVAELEYSKALAWGHVHGHGGPRRCMASFARLTVG